MQAEVIDSSQRNAWIEAFNAVVREQGRGYGQSLLERLMVHAQELGLSLPPSLTTPYVNTITLDAQPPYPGDRNIERRIKNVIRWNAMAMVAQANKRSSGIGGHISTYASCATLFEVGFHHFFRGSDNGLPGDQVFFQGHAAPGVYARAFIEGRIAEAMLHNFRRELAPGGGRNRGGYELTVAVLVLQALARQRGTARGGSNQEPFAACVAVLPDQIADALKSKDGIEEKKGN
jgi:pyruvate dehydrogenase E1 component